MVENLDLYMARTKASMEKRAADDGEGASYGKSSERSTAEISSVTDQSALFCFNSLNAGAQLAMMEDAEQTGIFCRENGEFFSL